MIAKFDEDLGFEFQNPLFRAEHLRLVFLEFGCRVPLRIDKSLFALVIGRDAIFIGVADLDEISEDVVEFDLERRDARAPALTSLDGGDVTLAAASQAAQ